MLSWPRVMTSQAVYRALRKKKSLKQAIALLSLLPAHDALCLLRNYIAMPKLLYTLRTSLLGIRRPVSVAYTMSICRTLNGVGSAFLCWYLPPF